MDSQADLDLRYWYKCESPFVCGVVQLSHVKNCLRTCATCAYSDRSAHALSIIRVFALFIHSVVTNDSIIGQERPKIAQSELGLRCPHMLSKCHFFLLFQKTVKISSLLPFMRIVSVIETSITGVTAIRSLNPDDSIDVPLMEIKTYKIAFR